MSVYILLPFTNPILSYQNKKGLIIPYRGFSYYLVLVYHTLLHSISSDEGEIGTKTHPHLCMKILGGKNRRNSKTSTTYTT